MRVLITGATGYVGAYAVQRLLAGGHDVRVMIRSRERLARNAGSIGVDLTALDVRFGDMTDAGAVREAVAGTDVVIHAAAVVAALNRSDAQRTIDANLSGTRTVITAAADAGCARIVYLSSVAALFTPAVRILTADLPPAVTAASPYTRSKAIAEQWVREQQESGLPILSVYPGGVTGPPAGDAFGEVAEGFVSMLKCGFVTMNEGAVSILDVRDLAAVLGAVCEVEQPPAERFITGGVFTTLTEIGSLLHRITGRRMPVLPLPGGIFRGLGHIVDGIRRIKDFETVFTAEAMDLLTLARPTDDSAVTQGLGIRYRDPAESVEAMVGGLYAAGRLSARQVGRVASATG